MNKKRLELFTDAVLAIIITIMVLELKAPEGSNFRDFNSETVHAFMSYVLSFFTLAIYWNNHHHMYQLAKKISGKILWLNMAFLFFASLLPLATSWIGKDFFSRDAQLFYGMIILMLDVVWAIVARVLVREHGHDSDVGEALGDARKTGITLVVISLGVLAGLIWPVAISVAVVLSLIPWIIPDRQIEEMVNNRADIHKTKNEEIRRHVKKLSENQDEIHKHVSEIREKHNKLHEHVKNQKTSKR